MGGKGSPVRTAELGVAEWAAQNHEVVTSRELHERGISSRRLEGWVEAGRLHRIYRGVFTVGNPHLTREGRWLAAVRACGPGSMLSHLSAGAFWSLLKADPVVIDVTAPRSRRPRECIRLHRPQRLPPEERALHGAIPVTTPTRTWIDLAAMVSDERLRRALSEGERTGILEPRSLSTALISRPGVPGLAAARRVLAAYRPAGGIHFRSNLERAFWEAWMARGLEPPEVNAHVCGFEVDLIWRRRKLVVELDGGRWHRTGADRERDEHRGRILDEAGHQLLRFSDAEIAADLQTCIATTAAALTRRA